MNTTNGKIAVQSKHKMVQALLKIMEVYEYKDITVTQIVQEASLSRNTFYRLFKDKDEILRMLFEDLFDQFFEQVKKQKIESFWNVMQLYFDFWLEKKDLLLLLQKNHLLQRMLEQTYDKSSQVFQFVHANDKGNEASLPLSYLLAFSVGGMHNMLIKWVECGMEIPAKQLIEKLRACLMYDGLSA